MSFSLDRCENIIIWGAGHGIGLGLVKKIKQLNPKAHIYACYRLPEKAQELLSLNDSNIKPIEINPLSDLDKMKLPDIQFDLCFISTGFLHDEEHTPEKSLQHFNREYFLKAMEINAYLPLTIAQAMIPQMKKGSILAALSAKVGSIEDNRIGGWYSYRSSKAALNMLLKTLSIDLKNRRKEITILSLHPGTTDTSLSAPFTSSISHKIFSTEEAAGYLIDVLEGKGLDDSGNFYSWNKEILPY